jgi:hypothetical protein
VPSAATRAAKARAEAAGMRDDKRMVLERGGEEGKRNLKMVGRELEAYILVRLEFFTDVSLWTPVIGVEPIWGLPPSVLSRSLLCFCFRKIYKFILVTNKISCNIITCQVLRVLFTNNFKIQINRPLSTREPPLL